MQHFLRLLFGSGADGERPLLITLLFWGGVIPTIIVRATVDSPDLRFPAWIVYVLLAILVAIWPRLRWQRGPGQATTWLFALVVLLVMMADGTGAAQLLMPVMVAQVVVVTGWLGAIIALVVFTATQALAMRLIYLRDAREIGGQALGLALSMALVATVTDLVLREQRRRLEYARLLDELTAAHTELADAHEELQKRSEQVRDLAVQAERARLAREVHDAVGHHLTVVKLDLTNALRLRGRDDDIAWSTVGDARDSASRALDEVRRAVRALGPGQLATTTLDTALRTLADSASRDDLRVTLTVTGEVRTLPAEVSAALYRVAEEALTNVRRHARGATQVNVCLDVADVVTLEVVDDGQPVDAVDEGFGLAGARGRMSDLNGTLTVTAQPSGGVALTARVPLPVSTSSRSFSAPDSPPRRRPDQPAGVAR